jgi:hypothetical protein
MGTPATACLNRWQGTLRAGSMVMASFKFLIDGLGSSFTFMRRPLFVGSDYRLHSPYRPEKGVFYPTRTIASIALP